MHFLQKKSLFVELFLSMLFSIRKFFPSVCLNDEILVQGVARVCYSVANYLEIRQKSWSH